MKSETVDGEGLLYFIFSRHCKVRMFTILIFLVMKQAQQVTLFIQTSLVRRNLNQDSLLELSSKGYLGVLKPTLAGSRAEYL